MHTRKLGVDPGQRVELPSDVVRWVSRTGAWMATIVSKASFDLREDLSVLSSAPTTLRQQDRCWPQAASVRSPSDMAPMKRGLDVVVVGHVHAPLGIPAFRVRARVRVGQMERALDVYGDRAWMADHSIGCMPFVRMPIIWERAAGGPGTANPGGMSPLCRRDIDGVLLLPNYVPANHQPKILGEVFAVEGFGPLPASWPERHVCWKAGAPSDWREAVSRDLVDPAFFNVAPPSQRISGMRPGDPIELDHLHPTLSQLRTHLPPLALIAKVREGSSEKVVPLRADTLLIDADAGIAELVFRGQLATLSANGPLVIDLFDVANGAVSPLAAEPLAPRETMEIDLLASAPLTRRDDEEVGGYREEPIQGPTFDTGPLPRPLRPASPCPEPSRLAPQPTLPSLPAAGDVLPFRALSSPPVSQAALDLTSSGPPARDATPRAPVELARLDTLSRRDDVEPRLGSIAGLPSSDEAFPAVRSPGETIGQRLVRERGPLAEMSKPSASRVDAARGSVEAATAPTLGSSAVQPPAAIGVIPGPAEDEVDEAPDPPSGFGASRYGAVRWLLEHGERPNATIFRSRRLDDDRWKAIHEHYERLVQAEVRRGISMTRDEVDAGYVAALEQDLGELTVERYASWVVMEEVGVRSSASEIPKATLPVVMRVIMKRCSRSPELRKAVETALRSARADRNQPRDAGTADQGEADGAPAFLMDRLSNHTGVSQSPKAK